MPDARIPPRCQSVSRKAGPWRIGFAGKFVSNKRPTLLLEAVGASQYRNRIQVVLIGDGSLRSELEQQARRANLSVNFRGFLNQSQIVERGYADLDGIILPSGEYEAWGLVVNEAMTGGIPAIVSDLVGCAPDLINEGVTGYIFRALDVKALTRQIDCLVEKLEAGHDFRPAVRDRIKKHSMACMAQGVEHAFLAATGLDRAA